MALPTEPLRQLLEGWMASLRDVPAAQDAVVHKLVKEYSQTRYGEEKGANQICTIDEFRKAFPVRSYDQYEPMVWAVMRGDHKLLCSEKPMAYGMTRGTTGRPKVIPCTRAHLDLIFECGSRVVVNQALRTNDSSLLEGYVLNLNFPSLVSQINGPQGVVRFGYSSGTYARLKPSLGSGGLVPLQEEIDALGPGIGLRDWQRRFELVFREAKDKPVVAAIGVTPVILSFARYLKRKHGLLPKEVWSLKCLFCTSVTKIHTEYEPELQKAYGQIPVREIYSATEGVFGQQLDDFPYIVPNFDGYLFEVKMGKKVISMHEMKKGQWGRLIVSTPVLPRYDIGDMIECLGGHYYRVFGRAKASVVLEHLVYRLLAGWAL